MINIFKTEEQKSNFISNYSNPFNSENVKKIEFTIEKSFWTNGEIKYKSCISFDSGKTTGYHRMEANSFVEIIEHTEKFIKTL